MSRRRRRARAARAHSSGEASSSQRQLQEAGPRAAASLTVGYGRKDECSKSKFQAVRRSRRLTVEQVAVAAKCSHRTIQLCDGGYAPRPLLRESLARVLGVEEKEIFPEVD